MVAYIVSNICFYLSAEIHRLDCFILVYDVLTGAIERCLHIRNNQYGAGREKCVRDVSWHPFENYIISTSVRFFNISFY